MAEFTGDDKVVWLLRALPPETAEAVLLRLAPVHAEKVRARMAAELPEVAPDVASQLSREFFDVLRIAERRVPPPPPPDPEMEAPPPPEEPTPETATEETPMPPPTPPAPPAREDAQQLTQALTAFLPETIAAALTGERASTVALVVSRLDVQQAIALLKLLPTDVRHEVAVRVGQPSPLKPDLVTRILASVVAKCREIASQPAQMSGDQTLQRLAELVRSLGTEDRREILARLEKSDAAAAEKVRKQLYTFEDIAKLDDRTLQGILGEMSTQTLALAVKGAPDALKEKILNNVSRRARDTISEELEMLASASPAMIAGAQEEFVQVLRKLDEEGKLSL